MTKGERKRLQGFFSNLILASKKKFAERLVYVGNRERKEVKGICGWRGHRDEANLLLGNQVQVGLATAIKAAM